MPRWLKIVLVGLVIFFIVTNPTKASSSVNNTGNWLYNAGTNVTTFLSNLAP